MMTIAMAIIPDTQIAAWQHPEVLRQMAKWIVDHREDYRIEMVLHLGDVVHLGANDERQFQDAKAALDMIDEAGVPMLIVPGNHDYDNLLNEDRSLDMFRHYFGVSRLAGREWLRGLYEQGKPENAYAVIESNGLQLLFIALEFGPRDEVLAWADGLLATYEDHHAIIVTHCYLYLDATPSKLGDEYNPRDYAGAEGANDGEEMWKKCFRKHRNIIAIYSGHQIPYSISYSVAIGDHGNPVFQSFQNWQGADKGGSGRFRLVTMNGQAGVLKHMVINPMLDGAEAGDGHEVEFCFREIDRSRLEQTKYSPL